MERMWEGGPEGILRRLGRRYRLAVKKKPGDPA
jgi:hypothetical protein